MGTHKEKLPITESREEGFGISKEQKRARKPKPNFGKNIGFGRTEFGPSQFPSSPVEETFVVRSSVGIVGRSCRCSEGSS